MRAAVDALGDGHCSIVLLAGPPGVGKSRLGSEIIDRLTALGEDCLRTAATSALTPVPFGAIAHLLPEAALPVATEGGAVAVFGLLRAAMDDRPADRPGHIDVLIDDVQDLDESSMALLTLLMNAGTVRLVATHRSERPLPDGLAGLVGNDRCLRVDLEPLDEPAVGELVTRVLGGAADGVTLRTFWELSRGNVLFLRELVNGSLASGALHRQHEIWTLADRPTGTPQLTDLIAGRLGRLDPPGRRLAELLAVCGPQRLDVIDELGDTTAAIALERDGLAVAGPPNDGSIGIAHPLYQEAIAAGLPEARRRQILVEHIDFLERHRDLGPADELRVAVWRLDAGLPADREVLVRGARIARFSNDFVVTRRLALAARANGAGDEVASILGDALYELGEFDAAARLVTGALERTTDEVEMTRLAMSLGEIYGWGLNTSDAAIEMLRATSRRLTTPILRDVLRSAEAHTLAFSQRPHEALTVLEQVVELAPPIPGLSAIARIVASAMVGATGRAVDAADQALATRGADPERDTPSHPSLELAAKSFALATAGRLAEAVEAAADGHALAAEARMPLNVIWAALNAGAAELYRGRLLSARRWALEAYALAESHSFLAGQRLGLTIAACAAGQCAERDESALLLDRLDALPPDRGFLEEISPLARVWALHVLGRRADARSLLFDTIDAIGGAGLPGSEGYLRHEALRLGWPGDPARFDVLLEQSDSELLRAQATHCAGIATRDLARLSSAEQSFVQCDARLAAAEVATSIAALATVSGEQRTAVGARRRAAEHLRFVEGAATPGLVELGESTHPLSAREREIALLAVTGRSSKEIGEALYLSRRTVENHLQRVYTKLGVASRAELGVALDPSESVI